MKINQFIYIIILTISIFFSCSKEVKNPPQTGVTVTKEKISGKNYFRITAIAKASEQAIQKGSTAMKQASACESAKIQTRQKIQELTRNPQASERLAQSQGIRLLFNGDYCETTYLLDLDHVPNHLNSLP